MKVKILALLVILSFFSCKNTESQDNKNWVKISERIKYSSSDNYFELKSGKNIYKIPKTALPLKKVVILMQ